MTLQHILRIVCGSIFQSKVVSSNEPIFNHSAYCTNPEWVLPMGYDNTFFTVPRIHCKDGFNISIQIDNANYCSSENGYRKMGYEWKTAEWGFPSEPDELLIDSAEEPDNLCSTVGSASVELLQELIDKHGGIDYDKTFSTEAFVKL